MAKKVLTLDNLSKDFSIDVSSKKINLSVTAITDIVKPLITEVKLPEILDPTVLGKTKRVANVTDIINTETKDALVLRVESYSNNSLVGGGTFIKTVDNAVPTNGIVFVSKDGNKFMRVPEDGFLMLEDFGWVPTANEESSRAFLIDIIPVVARYGGKLRLPRKGTSLYLNGYIYLDGIKELDGNGCDVCWVTVGTSQVHGFWSSQPVQRLFNHDFKMYNCKIRYHQADVDYAWANAHTGSNGQPNIYYNVHGINVVGANNVEIFNNELYGYNADRVILVQTRTEALSSRCKVHHNKVFAGTDRKEGKHCIMITSDGMLNTQGTALAQGMDTYYADQHDVPTVPFMGTRHEVYQNYCQDGYYGIILTQVTYCRIYRNHTKNNIRGIALQNRCHRNVISNNFLEDYKSSAMLCNYKCSKNIYTSNIGISSTSDGQAPIQLTVGMWGNVFEDNHFEVIGDAIGPLWFIYCGIDAKDNLIRNNTFTGPVRKAGILLESAWTNSSNDTAWSYVVAAPGSTAAKMASTTSSGNVISGNVLYCDSTVPAMVMHAGDDDSGAHNLVDNVLTGNLIYGKNHSRVLLMRETGNSKITGTTMHSNVYPSGLAATKFVPGSASMYALIGSDTNRPTQSWEPGTGTTINSGASIPFTATPVGATVDLVNGAITVQPTNGLVVMIRQPTNTATVQALTSIVGGVTNQIIYVRYARYISVTHNDQSIRLINSASTAELNGSKISTFLCLDGSKGIWTEVSRN